MICPTGYVEPFGGVAVEAMLCGVPVITSPFGAFTETIVDGVTGFRCHTAAEFRAAAVAAGELDPATIRRYAEDRFSLAAVASRYDRWLGQLGSLYDQGWYQ